jgi:ribonuclease HIII
MPLLRGPPPRGRFLFFWISVGKMRSLSLHPMPENEKPLTLYTSPLTSAQAEKLRTLLMADGYKFEPKPYTLFYAAKDKLNVAVYEKGPKVVLQGKGTQDFVTFRLEPEILGEAKLGYEDVHNPEMFAPHFGVDESGKGDFFGPLVIAGCYTDRGITKKLMDAGIQDSKKIGSDKRIRDLADIIKRTQGAVHSVVAIGPERYNQLYAKFGNLNRLLAWGHARIIENLLEIRPDCPRALSDQFANPALIKRALMEKGRAIQLDQRTKAESDVAVAAASILARERFIDSLRAAGREMQVELPRGASAQVKQVGRDLVAKHGGDVLKRVAKTHFKTASELAPDLFPRAPEPE